MNTDLMPNNIPHPQSLAVTIPYPAFLMSQVYLQAGLPPDAALRAALADYEHSFSSWELKLI